MKELEGSATRQVQASAAQCVALFEDVERYPDWYPDVVRSVEVTERTVEGRPAKARATLHVSVGPVERDFRLLLEVRSEQPGTVSLMRIPHDPSDHEVFAVTWQATSSAPTQIEVRLVATLSVPRLLPVGGVGDGLARGFVDAAARELAKEG